LPAFDPSWIGLPPGIGLGKGISGKSISRKAIFGKGISGKGTASAVPLKAVTDAGFSP